MALCISLVSEPRVRSCGNFCAKMSEGEEGEREIPFRITNVELAKLVKEQMAESRAVREENRSMKKELEKLKGKMIKGDADESEEEEVEREPYEEEIPRDQRPLLQALERVGVKGGDLPNFHGKLNLDECMDWLEALDNHFECDQVPASQRFKLAKTKLKGPALSWWNFLQSEREDEGKE